MTTTTAQHEALAALCTTRTLLDAATAEAETHHALVDEPEQADTWTLIGQFRDALDLVDAALLMVTDALPVDVQLLDDEDAS